MRIRSRRKTGRTKSSLLKRMFWTFSLGLMGWVGLTAYIVLSSRPFFSTNMAQLRPAPYGIVFGAGLRGGVPSTALSLRLDGAIQLYRQGKVSKLLMSGDNRFVDYNEPKAMQKYALARSVKMADIVMDFAGRDTYDTCFRAKNLFGVNRAIFVTQGYHMPRAIFVGRSLGIDATGLAVPNFQGFYGLKDKYQFREALADIKAWWDVSISHRKPYIESRLGKA